MILQSQKFKIKGINKQTQAKDFKHFRIGDIIQIKQYLKNTSNFGKGCFVTQLQIYNHTQNIISIKDNNTAIRLLSYYELEEEIKNV